MLGAGKQWLRASALAMLMLVTLASTDAIAHAIVLKTSLAQHPIRAGTSDSITLHFNSRIEVKLSRALLISRDQAERTLALAAGKTPGDIIVELPALVPGDYAVRFRVLAADGHVTEDTIRFSVAP